MPNQIRVRHHCQTVDGYFAYCPQCGEEAKDVPGYPPYPEDPVVEYAETESFYPIEEFYE